MKFFIRCSSKYCCNTWSLFYNMLYKDSKFEVFSDFKLISISYFSWCENNLSAFYFLKTLIKLWYSSNTINCKLIYDFCYNNSLVVPGQHLALSGPTRKPNPTQSEPSQDPASGAHGLKSIPGGLVRF